MRKSGKAPYVSEQDLEITMSNTSGKNALRNKAVLLFSHFLGLRAKEIAALKVGDVYDLKRGELKEVIRLVSAYTKGGKYREVFLIDEQAKQSVLSYLLTFRSDYNAEDPLFLSQKNTKFSANTMQRMIGNLYKKAGVNASSHSGRRSFATRLIHSNADIYSVQQLMGHTSIQTTQVYFSSDPNRLKDVVSRLKSIG